MSLLFGARPFYNSSNVYLKGLEAGLSYGITANNIAPGLIQTDRNAFRRADMAVWNRLARNANPMGRAGQPENVVGAALFLASDAASFVTGTTIHVTGGSHIARNMNDLINTETANARQAG